MIGRDLRTRKVPAQQRSHTSFQSQTLVRTRTNPPRRLRDEAESQTKTVEDLLALGLTDATKRASQRLRTQRLLAKQGEEAREQSRALQLRLKREKAKALNAKTSARAIRAFVAHKAGRATAQEGEAAEGERRRQIMAALNCDVRRNNAGKRRNDSSSPVGELAGQGCASTSAVGKKEQSVLRERNAPEEAVQRKPPVPRLSGRRRKRRVKQKARAGARHAKPPLPTFRRQKSVICVGSGRVDVPVSKRKFYNENQVRSYIAQKRRKALVEKKGLRKRKEELLQKKVMQLKALERRAEELNAAEKKRPVHSAQGMPRPRKKRETPKATQTANLLKSFQQKQQDTKVEALKDFRPGVKTSGSLSSICLTAPGVNAETATSMDVLEDIQTVMARQLAATKGAELRDIPVVKNEEEILEDSGPEIASSRAGEALGDGGNIEGILVESDTSLEDCAKDAGISPDAELSCELTSDHGTSSSMSPESIKAHARLEADILAMTKELEAQAQKDATTEESVLQKADIEFAKVDPGIGNSLSSCAAEVEDTTPFQASLRQTTIEATEKLRSEVEKISQNLLAKAAAEQTPQRNDANAEVINILNWQAPVATVSKLEQWEARASTDPYSVLTLLANEEREKAEREKLQSAEQSKSLDASVGEPSTVSHSESSVAVASVEMTSAYSEEFVADSTSGHEESFRSISPSPSESQGSSIAKVPAPEALPRSSSIALQTESEDVAVIARSPQKRKPRSPQKSVLSPGSLQRKLLASVNYLESLGETDKQLNALEHAKELTLSQQETVAVVERWKKQEEATANAAKMSTLSREYATRFDNTVNQIQEDVRAASADEIQQAKAKAAVLSKQLEAERKRNSQVQTDEQQTVERGTMKEERFFPRDIGVMTDRSMDLGRGGEVLDGSSEDYSADDFESGLASDIKCSLSQSELSEILPPDDVRRSRDEEFLNPNNHPSHGSPPARQVWSPDEDEEEPSSPSPRSVSILSPSGYSNETFINMDSRVDSSEFHLDEKCLSPNESLRSVVPDEAFLREQVEEENVELLDYTTGGGSFRKFAAELLQSYSRDVDVKRKHDLQILKMREKALKDKTREQLRWLVRQRDRAFTAKKQRAKSKSPNSSPKSEDTPMPTKREIEKRLEAERRKITFSFKAGKATIEAEKAALNESFYQEKIKLRKHVKIIHKLQEEITLYKKDGVDHTHEGLFAGLLDEGLLTKNRNVAQKSHQVASGSIPDDILDSPSLKSPATTASIKTLSFTSSVKSKPVESSYEKDSFLSKHGDELDELSFRHKIQQRDQEIAKMKEELERKNEEIAKLKSGDSFDGMLSQTGVTSAYSVDSEAGALSAKELSQVHEDSDVREEADVVSASQTSASIPAEPASTKSVESTPKNGARQMKASSDLLYSRSEELQAVESALGSDSFASTLVSGEKVAANESLKDLAEDTFASTFSSPRRSPSPTVTEFISVESAKDALDQGVQASPPAETYGHLKAPAPVEELCTSDELTTTTASASSSHLARPRTEESKQKGRQEIAEVLTEMLLSELVEENMRMPRLMSSRYGEVKASKERAAEEDRQPIKEEVAAESKSEEPPVRGELFYDWTDYIKRYIEEVFAHIDLKGGLQYKEDECVEAEEKSAGSNKKDAISLKTYIDIEKAAGRPEHLQIINKSIFDAMCEALVYNFPSEFCHIRESSLLRRSLSCYIKQSRPRPTSAQMKETSKCRFRFQD